MSYSGFFSINNSLEDTMKAMLEFYLPNGGVIYDPTHGEENYQFAWLEKHNTMALENWCGRKGQKVILQKKSRYQYICSDLKPTGNIIADVRALPLRDKFADITVYDPPFAPSRDSKDPRAKAFDIDHDRTAEDIKAYYNANVLQELARVSKQFIFMRGQDIYYPTNTTRYYPFYHLALHSVEKVPSVDLHAIYTLRYNHGKLPLFRYRLRHVKRPIVTYSNIAVLKVKEASA